MNIINEIKEKRRRTKMTAEFIRKYKEGTKSNNAEQSDAELNRKLEMIFSDEAEEDKDPNFD